MKKQIIISEIGYPYGYNVIEMIDGLNINEFIIGHLSTIEEQFPKSDWEWIML